MRVQAEIPLDRVTTFLPTPGIHQSCTFDSPSVGVTLVHGKNQVRFPDCAFEIAPQQGEQRQPRARFCVFLVEFDGFAHQWFGDFATLGNVHFAEGRRGGRVSEGDSGITPAKIWIEIDGTLKEGSSQLVIRSLGL